MLVLWGCIFFGLLVYETVQNHSSCDVDVSLGFPGLCFRIKQMRNGSHKVGPLLVTSGVITSISRVITPVTQLFSAICRGPITPFITIGSGPTLHGFVGK